MASSWSWSWLIAVVQLLPAVLVCQLGTMAPTSEAARAFFVFGDSLVDNGNNNYLATAARVNYPPYGIDAPDRRATGRFSNGKNLADIISEYLGSEPPLPYLSPELDGEKMLVGANFASGGAGILNDTGIQFGNVIHISKQLRYFAQYQKRLRSLIGADRTARLVNGALVLIVLGNNDFSNNYYLVPYSPRSRQFSLPDYVAYLISEYRQVLTGLYDLGARRVVVQGVVAIGCAPGQLALHSLDGSSCDREQQRAAELYNPRLLAVLGELNAQLAGGGPVFVGVDALRIYNDFIEDPEAYGFATATEACCGQGRFNGVGPCTVVSHLCGNRDANLWWDAAHPTERANRLIAQKFMSGSIDVISPMNLSTILAVDHIN